jgi:predicted nucleic acid-binding protein
VKYLIDTDTVVDYLVGNPDARSLLATLQTEGIAISLVTYTEIYEGIYASRDPTAAERGFRELLRSTTVLPFTRTVAKRTARVRRDLRAKRRPIAHRALDLVIAATALAYNLILVTGNRKDYDDIPELELFREEQPMT